VNGSDRVASIGEAVATAVLGAVLGGAVGLAVDSSVGIGLGVVAGMNGAISGWHGIYDWRSGKGSLAFVLDSTWGGLTTAAGLAAHAIAAVRRDSGYERALSHRHNRHVYASGFQLRRGFALTVGNVVSGAGDTSVPRRSKLVTDHEDVHVWQERWLGPIYPTLLAVWWGGAVIVGTITWMVRKRAVGLGKVIEGYGYYCNPLEWWAYSRDDHWPPSGKVPELGWKKPCVQPFTAKRTPTASADRI
jgi:hypothetical protein